MTALVKSQDPNALIALAIEKGAPIETLERLVSLAKEVRAFSAREAFFESMARFKTECPSIKKDATANLGQYSYSYATLDGILDVVVPILGRFGLTISWKQKHEGNAVHASCVVTHRLGHQEESGFIAIPFETTTRMNPAQRVGSAATYAKRYSLLAVLGLAPEDDDDARSTGERHAPMPHLRETRVAEESRLAAEAEPPAETLFPTPTEKDALVGRLTNRWRELGLTKANVKAILDKRGLPETLVRHNADWSMVDLAVIQDMLTEAGG
jgi:hypothetical protein